jgi:predicted transcriptional regulator
MDKRAKLIRDLAAKGMTTAAVGQILGLNRNTVAAIAYRNGIKFGGPNAGAVDRERAHENCRKRVRSQIEYLARKKKGAGALPGEAR